MVLRVPELLGRYEDRVRINIFRWGKTNNSGTQIEYYKATRPDIGRKRVRHRE